MNKESVIVLDSNIEGMFQLASNYDKIINRIKSNELNSYSIDFTKINHLSSEYISLVARLIIYCNDKNIELSITNCNKNVINSFKISKLDKICKIV